MKLPLGALVPALVLAFASAARADDLGVIVTFHGDLDPDVFARHGGRATLALSGSNAVAGRIPADRLRALRLSPNVAAVEEDVILHATLVPDDPRYATNQKAAFELINAPQAWGLSKGAGVRVCVLDTGVRSDHEDLSGKVKIGRNFTSATTTDFADRNGHGTHTSGTVGANTDNGLGVAGAGFDCELAMGKVLDDNGSGNTSWIAAGIDWASQTSGARIISMSFGGGGTTALRNAVNAAWTNGLLLVAAAGNNNNTTIDYPGGYANVVSVASCDAQGVKSSFSSYGSVVDIAAPGSNIHSTSRTSTSSYATLSGTSMATPHVAGVSALLWAKDPSLSNSLLRLRLEGSPTRTVSMPDGREIPLLDAFALLTSTLALPVVTITADHPDALEEGPVAGSFKILRTGATTADLSVALTVAGTAVNGSDDASLPASIVIPAGAAFVALPVTPQDDATLEPDETVQVSVAAGGAYTVGTPSAATVVIHDNDAPPVVTVAATDPDAAEAGAATGTFTFTRAGKITLLTPLTVHFSVSGTAESGTDYVSLGTSVTIPAGAASATKTVTPIDDDLLDPDETVVVTLVADPAYTVGAASKATVTIDDDEAPPPAPSSVGGGGGHHKKCGLVGLEALLLLAVLAGIRRR